MKKKIVIALSLSMAISLAACGMGGNQASGAGNNAGDDVVDVDSIMKELEDNIGDITSGSDDGNTGGNAESNVGAGNVDAGTADTGNDIGTSGVEAGNINEGSEGTSANPYVSDAAQEILDALETDYNSVMWGVEYAFGDDNSGLIVSATPVNNEGTWYLLVGITNVTSMSYSISGEAIPLDADGNELLGTYVDCPAIGSGNTYMFDLFVGADMPTGRIRWANVLLEEATNTYTPWEAEWAVEGNAADGMLTFNYRMYGAGSTELGNGEVYVLLLDESGYVVGYSCDYVEETAAGEAFNGSIFIFNDPSFLTAGRSIAMFTNPTK